MHNQEIFKQESKIERIEYPEFGSEWTHASSWEISMDMIQSINNSFDAIFDQSPVWSSAHWRDPPQNFHRSQISQSVEDDSEISFSWTTFRSENVSSANFTCLPRPSSPGFVSVFANHRKTVISYCWLPIRIALDHVDQFPGCKARKSSRLAWCDMFSSSCWRQILHFLGKYSLSPRIGSHNSSNVYSSTRNIPLWPDRRPVFENLDLSIADDFSGKVTDLHCSALNFVTFLRRSKVRLTKWEELPCGQSNIMRLKNRKVMKRSPHDLCQGRLQTEDESPNGNPEICQRRHNFRESSCIFGLHPSSISVLWQHLGETVSVPPHRAITFKALSGGGRNFLIREFQRCPFTSRHPLTWLRASGLQWHGIVMNWTISPSTGDLFVQRQRDMSSNAAMKLQKGDRCHIERCRGKQQMPIVSGVSSGHSTELRSSFSSSLRNSTALPFPYCSPNSPGSSRTGSRNGWSRMYQFVTASVCPKAISCTVKTFRSALWMPS